MNHRFLEGSAAVLESIASELGLPPGTFTQGGGAVPKYEKVEPWQDNANPDLVKIIELPNLCLIHGTDEISAKVPDGAEIISVVVNGSAAVKFEYRERRYAFYHFPYIEGI